MEDLNYTIVSTDSMNYSFVNTNLFPPPTQQTTFTITCLTTQCTIVVLDIDDYIMINGTKYEVNDKFTIMDPVGLKELLNSYFDQSIHADLTRAQQLTFESAEDFVINDASYRMKIITGLYSMQFPVTSSNKRVLIPTVGYYLSTPVLYLVSNIGQSCFQNEGDHSSCRRIVMRVNNSFSPNVPIIVTNAEFSSTIASSALSHVWFQLVDANFVQVKLLSPMHIFGVASPIVRQVTEDEQKISTAYNKAKEEHDAYVTGIAKLMLMQREVEEIQKQETTKLK